MKAVARASIDLQGRDLRYAELEQYGSRYRLLRLGSCDFDFDVVRELVQEPESKRLLSVRDALRDVLSGSVASVIRFVLHPPAVRTFFAAVPTDLPPASRHIRAQQEAALLYGIGPSLSVDQEVASQRPGAPHATWQCVSVTIADVRRKLTRVAAALPGADVEVSSGRAAAGHALRRYQHVRGEAAENSGVSIAVGCFPTHYDIAYGYEGEWLYSYAASDVVEADAAFLSAEMLRRLGFAPSDVTTLMTYGSDDRPSLPSFERLYGVRSVIFDPLMLVNLDPATIEDGFEGGAFLQCVGGAL